MSYFGANGQPLGATPEPPQAAANGFGRYFGYDDPQAAANGLGRHQLGRHRLGIAPEPPQAQANGLGRFGMIGMLPPQAQAGVGNDMTPSGVPEGPMRSWRDGVFGARRPPQPYGDQLYPWRDGVFGPGLGQPAMGPTISLDNPDVGNEIKAILNLLVSSYSATPGGAYDQATEAAYVTYIEEQTPGYPEKTELYQLSNGHRYPSARGIYVLMGGARQAWQIDVGYDESFVKVAQWYPLLNAFVDGYEAAGTVGTVTLPAAANGNGNGAMQASTVMLVGAGAVGIGLIAVLTMRPKKKRRATTTPNRRRRRRRRR